MLELVKLPPPKGVVDRPEEELADPVLALFNEAAEDVADDTPSSPSPQGARAPFRESMEGVGGVIFPDFVSPFLTKFGSR